jgi:peptidoglycan hydrolase-like protein with peptidoglycan-binding domain
LRFNFRFLRLLAIAVSSLLLAIPSTASSTKTSSSASKTHKSAKSGKSSNKSSKSKKKSGKSASHGQKGIDQERTRQIQEALIREHYLQGEPTGKWDESTKDALAKFQEANGWQTKSVPDSRALIKLGLGPDKKGLLNPDTAAVSPHEVANAQDSRPGGSTQPQQ